MLGSMGVDILAILVRAEDELDGGVSIYDTVFWAG